MFVICVVCCQVEVSATIWSLVQRSPTDCGASLCVIKKPRERGSHSPRWAAEQEKTNKNLEIYNLQFYAILLCFRTLFQWRTHELFRKGGGVFNKFSWEERAERAGSGGGKTCILIRLLWMYFIRNWEFGSALSKLRNFVGGEVWMPPNPLQYATVSF
jgi:hypothetical protein